MNSTNLGFEHWQYMDWICYACSVRVAELEREQKELHLTLQTSLTPKSSGSSVISQSSTDRRTTRETSRTEITNLTSKSGKTMKTVRFGVNDVFQDADSVKTIEEKVPLFNRWKAGARMQFKRVGRCLKYAGRRIERPVITVLMRLGY
jgi:hypothetical protein